MALAVPIESPYANAPTLPDGEVIDPRIVLGSGSTPVELEIGPGRGGFLVERLESKPDAFVLGLEVRRKWAAVVDERLRARGLSARGRVFAEDARSVLPRLASGTVSAVFLHFPDPWWKKRHRKRRVATGKVLDEIVRILVPGGELFYQTDVDDRALAFEELIAASAPLLEPFGDAVVSARVAENPYGARSPRERRARLDGLPIVRLRYRLGLGAASPLERRAAHHESAGPERKNAP